MAELIVNQRDSTGLSYRAMAARAEEAGYKIKFQTLQELATGDPKGWPRHADTFAALSAALGVPQRTLVLSYARSLGIDVSTEDSLLETMLPAGTANIAPEVQSSIAMMVSSIVASGAAPADPPEIGYNVVRAFKDVRTKRGLSDRQRADLTRTIEDEAKAHGWSAEDIEAAQRAANTTGAEGEMITTPRLERARERLEALDCEDAPADSDGGRRRR